MHPMTQRSLHTVTSNEETVQCLSDAGYASVFDIARQSEVTFCEQVSILPQQQSKEIHALAKQRVACLSNIIRAYRSRNEPVLQSIPKLGIQPSPATLSAALERSLGDAPDFGELFPERSEEGYADAASIQSLFSPGRYLTELYKVAQGLHAPNSPLNIDVRRPDIKDLVLSESTMQQECSTLDVLLEVLQTPTLHRGVEVKSSTVGPVTAKTGLAPEVRNLTMSGIARVGETLTASYTFFDADLDAEGASTFRWERSNTDGNWSWISGATNRSFTITSNLLNFRVRVYVTPIALSGNPKNGTEVRAPQSDLITAAVPGTNAAPASSTSMTEGHVNDEQASQQSSVTPPAPAMSAQRRPSSALALATTAPVVDTVAIAGVPTVGQTLTGSYRYVDAEGDPEGPTLFRWYRSGCTGGGANGYIPGANRTTYTLVPADEGGTIQFGVEPVASTGAPQTTLAMLAEIYHPMTLPYHDNLVQIRSILSARQSSLQQVWGLLADLQARTFAPLPVPPSASGIPVITPSPFSREELKLPPKTYALLVGPPANKTTLQAHYDLDTDLIHQELQSVAVFTDRTGLTFNQLMDMTAQADSEGSNATAQSVSRFFAFGNSTPVNVYEYGQGYLAASTTPTPLLVVPDGLLNLTASNALVLADRAERLIRLQQLLKVDFPQLDWLIRQANRPLQLNAQRQAPLLDKPILDALAHYSRLNHTYGLSSDAFACFMGQMNIYAAQGQQSLYQQRFTSPIDGTSVPLNTAVNFTPAAENVHARIIAGGLGVSGDELFAMAKLVFTTPAAGVITPSTAARLYRLAMIPRLLGTTFAEIRVLWKMLNPTRDLADVIAKNDTLEVLTIIRQSESVLHWLRKHQLDINAGFSLTTDQYSETVTPELYNFALNIYTSLSSDPLAATPPQGGVLPPSMEQKLHDLCAATFKIKSNVMARLIQWLDMHFVTAEDGEAYGLSDFWADIHELFSGPGAYFQELFEAPDVARYSQALAQYALIAQWASLTEQDLALVVDTPEWFTDHPAPPPQPKPPRPSLKVLLYLARLKEWQQRVVVPEAEALGYFTYANKANQDVDTALAMLVYIHGWDLAITTALNGYLVAQGVYGDFPTTFAQLGLLEAWMQVGLQTGIGSISVDGLYEMSLEHEDAEDFELIQRVAEDFAATLHA